MFSPVDSGHCLPDPRTSGGFWPAARRQPGQRRARALVQCIAAVGLVISLTVAATAVSIGLSRADAAVTYTVR